MLKFQEAAKCVSGPRALSAYPKTLIARRYVVQQKLGSGSFGTVYLVSDKKAKQGEELKVLKEISVGELNPNETVQANLEAQLLSKLDHPAIVKFHASFVEQDNFCIITEYCEVRLSSFGILNKNLFHGKWHSVKGHLISSIIKSLAGGWGDGFNR